MKLIGRDSDREARPGPAPDRARRRKRWPCPNPASRSCHAPVILLVPDLSRFPPARREHPEDKENKTPLQNAKMGKFILVFKKKFFLE